MFWEGMTRCVVSSHLKNLLLLAEKVSFSPKSAGEYFNPSFEKPHASGLVVLLNNLDDSFVHFLYKLDDKVSRLRGYGSQTLPLKM